MNHFPYSQARCHGVAPGHLAAEGRGLRRLRVSWGAQRAGEEEPVQFGFPGCPCERSRAHWKMKTQEVNELH